MAAAEIDGLRRALGDGSLGRVGPHLTLVPPVNVRLSDLDEAVDVVRAAAAGTSPLELVLGAAATFWPATPVVYLGVGGDLDAVGRIRAAVGVGPLERPTTWPFVPHVTIAEDVDPALIPGAVAALASYEVAVTMTTVQLLEERPDRSWQPLAEVTLSGRRVVGRGGLEVVLEAGEVLDSAAADWLGRYVEASWGRAFAVAARREGRVVGAAVGTTRPADELSLDALVVDADTRGQGVGRQLLRSVEGVGIERDCRLAVAVIPADSPGRTWFRAHGWVDELDLPAWRGAAAYVRMRRDL